MFDCNTFNFDCSPYYNGCPPTSASLITEFPKQTGPFVEKKFSNFIPPTFLLNRNAPKSKVKTRSCSCSAKTPKVSFNCKCKDKGISDCRKIDKESGQRVCNKSCDAKSDNVSEADDHRVIGKSSSGKRVYWKTGNGEEAQEKSSKDKRAYRKTGYGKELQGKSSNDNQVQAKSSSGAIPPESNPNNTLGISGDPQASEGVWSGPDPVIPVYDYRDELNPMNQVLVTNEMPVLNEMPRPLNEMPAAGLPTRKNPQFDPCTGQERQAPSQQQAIYAAPFDYMYPNYCPIPSSPLPCCPCPAAINMYAPMPGFQQPANINEPGENAVEATNPTSGSTSREGVEKSTDKRNASNQEASTQQKEKTKNSKRENNRAMKIVKCNDVSKDLIKQICNSLQISRPPVDCYIVLPIPMAAKSKSKTKTSSSESKKSFDYDSTSAAESNVAPPPERKSANAAPPAKLKCKTPTRNCGCNTTITGKFDESSDNSEGTPASKDKDKGKDDNNGACCSTGGCYYRPRYKYCYNPCTGCFYWRKQCCCCNGCCSNGAGGGGSCPIQKQAGKPDAKSSNSTPSSSKKKTDTLKDSSRISTQSKRSTAGALSAFQPCSQDTYNQWMGFQQQPTSMTRPPLCYRSPRFFPSQFQMNSRRFVSQSQLNGRHQSPDIDWTPQ
ncbi:uncharacterized protein LOC117567030 isoform X2 [Drosophila albomicans]|uniref:Uncharacterized protein LOC117567030 isoform X2 n=1 Tax=Drosophila albomicans TaxID=7291 RepID=A0A6P8WHJ6_DROAB|nr:uncharacterized protein LOC117567030 isoform X2 [Drosophila albomicans]